MCLGKGTFRTVSVGYLGFVYLRDFDTRSGLLTLIETILILRLEIGLSMLSCIQRVPRSASSFDVEHNCHLERKIHGCSEKS